MNDFKLIFNNLKNGYYGHGTNGNENILNSIFEYGLRNSHGTLYHTTISLGPGEQINENILELLNNWPHLNSKKIVIISLPLKFHIYDSAGIGTYLKSTEAFSYIPNDEARFKEPLLIDGSYTMPEFIKGYYDVNTKKFIFNPNYYEDLSIEEQNKLFDIIKQNYIRALDETCGILEYKEIINYFQHFEFPVTDDDIEKYKKEKLNYHL